MDVKKPEGAQCIKMEDFLHEIPEPYCCNTFVVRLADTKNVFHVIQ